MDIPSSKDIRVGYRTHGWYRYDPWDPILELWYIIGIDACRQRRSGCSVHHTRIIEIKLKLENWK